MTLVSSLRHIKKKQEYLLSLECFGEHFIILKQPPLSLFYWHVYEKVGKLPYNGFDSMM